MFGRKIALMRPVEFGEALTTGTRLTLFSDNKPDRFFRVIKFWMGDASGITLALRTGVPSCELEDEEGRIHLLLHLPIEEEDKDRWGLWRPDYPEPLAKPDAPDRNLPLPETPFDRPIARRQPWPHHLVERPFRPTYRLFSEEVSS